MCQRFGYRELIERVIVVIVATEMRIPIGLLIHLSFRLRGPICQSTVSGTLYGTIALIRVVGRGAKGTLYVFTR